MKFVHISIVVVLLVTLSEARPQEEVSQPEPVDMD